MYDPALENFAIFVRVLEFTMCFSMCIITFFFVRDIAWKKWTRFSVILVVLMLITILITAMVGIAANETITLRTGLDTLPNNPTLNTINTVITSSGYFEYVVGLIYVFYLRAISVMQFKPKYQQNLLKFAVFFAMLCYQVAQVYYFLGVFQGVDYEMTSISGNIGTGLYFFIDVYYLVQFISILRAVKRDSKLDIIAKYGIFQTVVFFVTLILGFQNNGSMAMGIWVTVSPWLDCAAFAKMCYDLKATPEHADSTSEKPSMSLANSKSGPAIQSQDLEKGSSSVVGQSP